MSEDPNVPPAAAEAEKHRRWIVIAIVVVAAIIVLVLAIRSASWSSVAAPQEAASTSIRDELAATEEGILAAVEEQRRSLARAKLHELRQAGDNVDHTIGELETENATWNERVITKTVIGIGQHERRQSNFGHFPCLPCEDMGIHISDTCDLKVNVTSGNLHTPIYYALDAIKFVACDLDR